MLFNPSATLYENIYLSDLYVDLTLCCPFVKTAKHTLLNGGLDNTPHSTQHWRIRSTGILDRKRARTTEPITYTLINMETVSVIPQPIF